MSNLPELSGSPLVVLGKIVSVHGIRGSVKIKSDTDPLDNALDYPEWILRKDNQTRSIKVLDGRVQGRVLVVNLEGVADRDQALSMVGYEICVAGNALPDLDAGEYYWHQLEGLQVVTVQGELLGLIDHLLETGSNDVIVVKPCEGSLDQRERLLPYLPDLYVKSIDLQAGVMQVDWDPEF
jgi:16S rRNA processing protein RimM